MATSVATTRLAGPSRQPPSASYATFSPSDPLIASSDQPLHPQSQASWVSRLLLTWVSPLMALGNTRHLTEHDVWPLQRENQSDYVAVQFGRDYGATRSLVTAFLRSFGARFTATGAAYLCVALCSLVGPLVLHEVVASLSSGSYAIATLLQWIAVLFAAQVVQALADNYANLDSQLMAIQFTGAIKHLLYAKAMTLSADARRQKSVGDITTLYTMDCAHLIRTVNVAHQLWILPLQIVAASGVLYWLLGVASLAGLVTVLGVLYVNHSLSSVVQKLQGQFMRLKDARMKRVAETFRAISLVKFNAWESRMANRIGTARDAEVASIRQYFRLDIARTVLTAGMPIFISVVTFAVYAGLLGHALTPALVFTSLSLFRLIQQPLRQIAGIYSTLIRVRVSADRIADFFALPELAPRSSSSYSREEDLVVVEDGAFGWDRSVDVAAAPLQRVNLRLRHDDLVVVHGPVGCGKSSLCAAILGEMTTLRGRVCVNASVAYCSQQPWIQNMTLRDNILFGTRWDEQRYAAVLDACALTHDLASLPAGDLTEIGERGVNLSGGQKARVALARACYANADVYLLDAPLAAVDAIVANEIFQKCVLGLLRHKAVLLVTHNPEIMASPFVTMAVTVSPDGELQETVARRTTPPPEATIEPLPPKALVAEQRVDTATSDSTEAKGEPHKLVQKENREQGRVGASVFSAYYAAIGGFWIVLLVLATQAIQQVLQVGGSFWLGHWSSSSVSTTKGLTVYTLLGGLAALLVFVQTLTVYLVGLRAAQSLFNRMTRALLHAPLGFFDATPIGRLLGRYAEDVSIVDFTLPTLFSGFIASLFTVASSLLTAAVVIQWRGLLLLPLVVIYARVGAFYIEPAREIERFHKTTWSPILSHLAASLEGAATVRAFGTTSVQRFRDLNDHKLDTRNMAWYANLAFSQWFVLRVQLLGCVAVLVVASSLVLLHDALAPAIVGLAFSYALGISQNMEQIVQLWSSIETRMVSPERLHEYISIDQERAFDLPAKDLTLTPGWPLAGAISFQHVSFRYASAASPLVLRDVSLTIKACEKVGIVGRTGAGKSSLTMALFRINELAAGTITIDGVDTSTIGLKTLRERLSIIPQNPVLFQGPLRAYLDPFDEYADEDLWHAIRRVGLSDRIGSDDQKLMCPVEENGENFSVGERQMLCMARALLRHSRIVVFDEATAAMDHETDQKLQRVVREAFADSTVVTIAHRLDTVLDADRIVVMERGEVVEFASPRELVAKGTGHFFDLMDEGGYLDKFLEGQKEKKTTA